ncbi:kinase-like domain-containing protein, partial [Cryomyces antarcticus]
EKVIDVDASHLTLILEYVPRTDLPKYIHDQSMSQLSEDAQCRIWADIIGALEYIHNQDILHHDIKPENIMLGDDICGAVLCDFGSFSIASHQRVPNNAWSPCCIPPEYLLDEPERSLAGDVWAFGVTMLFVSRLMPLPRGAWRIADR